MESLIKTILGEAMSPIIYMWDVPPLEEVAGNHLCAIGLQHYKENIE